MSHAYSYLGCLLILLLSAGGLHAQDQHFSQFFASPLTLNPALTGQFDGKYRASIIHRDQWRQMLETPFITTSAAADFRYYLKPKQRRSRDAIGVGMVFYNDRIAEINFNTNQIMVSAAFHKALNPKNSQYLSIGAQLGIAQRNISYDLLTFEDEFDGNNVYSNPTGEQLPENNFAYFDMQVGLNYTYAPQRGTSVYAGVAMFHVLRPEQSFYASIVPIDPNEEPASEKIFQKYTAYLNFGIPLGKAVKFSPRALLYVQGPHQAANVGAGFRFLLNEIGGTAFHVGGWARPVRSDTQFNMDAAIGMVGLEFSNILLGLSYDIGLSNLSGSGQRRNAFELSVSYLGEQEEDDAVLCPKF
ncbi:MAG: PorP/SprF family type IX secretion system membrane protein [Saprospiraceae bacterium]